MPNLNIKNVPKELYDLIKERAATHRRSMNSEVLVALEWAVGTPRVDPARFLTRLDRLHRRLHGPPLTDVVLRATKRRGRP